MIAPQIAHLELECFMREALKEAEAAGEAGEYPIGAVLVIGGEVVSRGRARHAEARSQLRHAELNALLAGGEKLWQDFDQGVLFTTLEPCPMCLGATVMADVPHIIFALPSRVVHSAHTVRENPYVRRHIRTYMGGVLEAESRRLMARYHPELLRYEETGRLE